VIEMPPNRRRITRGRRHDIPCLDETVLQFLLTGEVARGTPGWSLKVSRFFDGGQLIDETRNFYRDEIEAEKMRKEKGK